MIKVDSILLVDDDESVNFLHKAIIEQLNIAREVFIKNAGNTALDFIRERYYSAQSLPSLILVDIHMPGMNGFDFIRELLHSDLLAVKKIPVALLTYSDAVKDISEARRLGKNIFIPKPLTDDKLLRIINNLHAHFNTELM